MNVLRKPGALATFAVANLLVYGASALVTASSVGDWYQALNKPRFNPPDWVFAPTWTVLFSMMTVAGWLAWTRSKNYQRRMMVRAYAVQLLLNLLWSVMFFGLHWIEIALIEILFLWASIIWTTYLFRAIDLRATWLFVPYALWVTFAVVLNAGIWWLNTGTTPS